MVTKTRLCQLQQRNCCHSWHENWYSSLKNSTNHTSCRRFLTNFVYYNKNFIIQNWFVPRFHLRALAKQMSLLFHEWFLECRYCWCWLKVRRVIWFSASNYWPPEGIHTDTSEFRSDGKKIFQEMFIFKVIAQYRIRRIHFSRVSSINSYTLMISML